MAGIVCVVGPHAAVGPVCSLAAVGPVDALAAVDPSVGAHVAVSARAAIGDAESTNLKKRQQKADREGLVDIVLRGRRTTKRQGTKTSSTCSNSKGSNFAHFLYI